MPDRDAILAAIDFAFGPTPRPAHFTNYRHCEECAEHDRTFRVHTPETIGLDELGLPGWDPVCFVTVEGFRYYMPAFARLILDGCKCAYDKEGRPYNPWYLPQFLFHLNQERIASFDDSQRQSVLALLLFVLDAMPDDVEQWADADRLLELIEELDVSKQAKPT